MIIVYNDHEKHFANKLYIVCMASLTMMFTRERIIKTETTESYLLPENRGWVQVLVYFRTVLCVRVGYFN